jgi:4-hydroxy-3-polyprenylbenzoate decarboxylase
MEMDDIALMLGENRSLDEPETQPKNLTPEPRERALRVAVGMTGASGAVYGVDFLKRCPGDKYLVASKWARMILHTEMGLRESDLEPWVKARFPDSDLSAPLASGSNPFDAFVIVPCSASTAAKIAAGIGDTLITRTAQVALKEKRRLILAIRETPLSGVTLEALTKLSREGAIIFPLSPGWYENPKSLEDLVVSTTNKLLSLVGVEVPGGWRGDELE